MPNQYSPKRFFRDAPNRMLQQYFAEKKVLSDFDFEEMGETKVDPLYKVWLALPDDQRVTMEQDFQDIVDLASEGGSKAIIDEARFHGEDSSAQFSQLEGFLEHAFWTFLERRDFWEGALLFHHADNIPPSYWRKRKNLPSKKVDVRGNTMRAFARELGLYFHTTQGRGKNCVVECYKRGDLDYFFAFPEDYSQASIEWENSQFRRRPHHPAFEVIFVYSQNDGTLDLYVKGDRKIVPDLQALFAEMVLHDSLGADDKDDRVYNLERLKSRHFEFHITPESGIESVAVKKLRLNLYGTKGRIVLEADPTHNKYAVHDLLDRLTKNAGNLQYGIGQVGIKVKFRQNPKARRAGTRTFDVTWPNSCSLKNEGRDLRIREMLVLSGIEPKKPPKPDGGDL